jgi:hypothetical protein
MLPPKKGPDSNHGEHTVSRPLRELAQREAEIRGDPLTPEQEAHVRAQERRKAMEMRIRHEEWAQAVGFPYWPRWVLPAFVVILGVLVFLVGFLLLLLLTQRSH